MYCIDSIYFGSWSYSGTIVHKNENESYYYFAGGFATNPNPVYYSNNLHDVIVPTLYPTQIPSSVPTYPSFQPSSIPTNMPSTSEPSYIPSSVPSKVPTSEPSMIPSNMPYMASTMSPSHFPARSNFNVWLEMTINGIFLFENDTRSTL